MTKKPRRLAPMLKDIIVCLFKKPNTRQYPVVKVEAEPGYRGRHILYPDKCISCSLCEKDCPANAIELVEVAGKRMPMFYLDRCVFCYQCVESCPREAIRMSTNFELSTTDREEMLVKPDEFVSKKEETATSEG